MSRHFLSAAALGGYVAAAASSASAQGIVTTTRVPTPDGVELATDVWRLPFDSVKRPVVLRRTPYGRAMPAANLNALLSLGYVVVSQDVRGRGNSTGEFLPFTTDKEDGKATIDWIAAQPFSNGNVGTYSGSAEGIVQYMAMAASPDALRCSHLVMPAHDIHEVLFPGGAWRTDVGTAWLTTLQAAHTIPHYKSHEVRDAYWERATLTLPEMGRIRHPVFVIGGLFDVFAPNHVRAFTELRSNVPADRRNDVFLVLGAWTHGGVTARRQGELLYPEDATYQGYVNEMAAYLGWCLKGEARPALPNLRYYTTEITDTVVTDPTDGANRIGALGEWRQSDTWPPHGVREQTLYGAPGGKLAGAPAADCTSLGVLDVNPENPVPSLGGGNLSTPDGPYDQKGIDARPDVLVLETEPATEAVDIAGSVHARVWASSATTDADVVMRVEVVTAGGRAIALTDGIRRGRFVGGMDAVRALTPGAPALFDVASGPMAVRLTSGQALRVALSGTSSPRYEPNPNLATPLASVGAPVATELTIHCGAGRALRVDVPVHSGRLPGALDVPDAGAPDGDAGADASAGGVAGTGGSTGGTTAATGGTAATAGGASSGTGGTGGGSASGGAPSASGASGDCGCRAVGRRNGGGLRALIAGLAAGGVLLKRRRDELKRR